MEGIPAEDRVYLDEMGGALNLNLDQGRSRRGEPAHDTHPTAPGTTVNSVAVLTPNGLEAVDTYTGSMTAERFVLYLEVFILNLVVGGKVLIMDNHPVHHARPVRQFLDDHEIPYIYLPTYSPELNPIEEAFSKAKHDIRKRKPRLFEGLIFAIHKAFKSITPDDAVGYFNHAEEFLDVTV